MAAVLVLVVVAGPASSMTVNGTATVPGMTGLVTVGSACQNSSMVGTPVTIYDAAGELVGSTSLTGYGTARYNGVGYYAGYADSCEYSFTLSDVPADGAQYRVKVGAGSGDGVAFSREQLETSGASVRFG